MSFNTRFVDKEKILEKLKEKEPLSKLFSADAYIFVDDFSTKVFDLYVNGKTDKEIYKIIKDGQD
jgi:hypothetical protein